MSGLIESDLMQEKIVKLETDNAFLKTDNASLKADNASLNERISLLWEKNMELEARIRQLEEGGWALPCERIQQSCHLDSDTILADAQRWMSDKGELAKESCDMNAKLCWALIVGQCDKAFVDIPFGGIGPEDMPRGRRLPLEVVNEFKQTLLNKCDTFVLLIRFISESDTADVHTLLLYKQGNSIITFQAYRDKSKLKKYFGDKSENAFQRAMKKEPITSETFGVESDDNNYEEAWKVAEECVIGFKQL